MKTIRKLHLWLGVLFAPTILFFTFSGALQILGLHEGSDASPVAAKLARIHKDQRVAEVERRPRPPASDAKPAPREPVAPRPAPPPRSMVLVVFFLVMAVGLMTSTVLGVYMAFGYRRERRAIVALLAAGIALPVLGLFL